MNMDNQRLQAINRKKTIITKKYREACKRCRDDEETLKKIDERFIEDMKILDKEEKDLLKRVIP